jgi:hypothetical protein
VAAGSQRFSESVSASLQTSQFSQGTPGDLLHSLQFVVQQHHTPASVFLDLLIPSKASVNPTIQAVCFTSTFLPLTAKF